METIHSVRMPKVEYGRLHPPPTDFLSRNLDAGIPLRFIPAYGNPPLAVMQEVYSSRESMDAIGNANIAPANLPRISGLWALSSITEASTR